jgi:hypothetical protein
LGPLGHPLLSEPRLSLSKQTKKAGIFIAKRAAPSVVFKMPFHKNLRLLKIGTILRKYVIKYCDICPAFKHVFEKNPPLICWKKAQNMADIIMSSKQC